MTFDQVQALMQSGNIDTCKVIFNEYSFFRNISDFIKQYLPVNHAVNDLTLRPDKSIQNDQGVTVSQVPVARITLPYQKRIVLVAAAFLGIPKTEATPENDAEQNMLDIVNKVWEANKLDYKFKKTAKITMSECQCAELWYPKDVDEAYWDGFQIDSRFQLSMQLLATTLGDRLFPIFDQFGNMVAFGRGYTVKEIDPIINRVIPVEHFDVYTEQTIWMSKKTANSWLFLSPVLDPISGVIVEGQTEYSSDFSGIPNPFGKIPVIYYSQPQTEWHDVQSMIDRLEKKISNHADTNDYFDSPTVVAKGTTISFAQKGESGKFIQADNGADLSYLTWDQAPESMKLEMENLQKFIMSFTHTPDLSFENMKGLGVFSGIALKMLFLDAHLKAADKEEIFGEGLQRRINLIKAMVTTLDESTKAGTTVDIKPKFEYFLPQNLAEQMDVLVKAYGSDILSQKTAVTLNPLVTDPETELEQILAEVPPIVDPIAIPVR